MRLIWKLPDSDGGERIKSYFIEKRCVTDKAWTRVNAACASQAYVVPGLLEGQDYLFRVRAENRLGFGPFTTTTDPAHARDPICEDKLTPGSLELRDILPPFKPYACFSSSDPPDPPTKLKVNLVTKNTVTLSWECPKNNGGSPVTHYIIERLSWDTSGKEKETWKQCNKRDVEDLSFVVEDLKEASPTFSPARRPSFRPLLTWLCVCRVENMSSELRL